MHVDNCVNKSSTARVARPEDQKGRMAGRKKQSLMWQVLIRKRPSTSFRLASPFNDANELEPESLKGCPTHSTVASCSRGCFSCSRPVQWNICSHQIFSRSASFPCHTFCLRRWEHRRPRNPKLILCSQEFNACWLLNRYSAMWH